MPCMKGSVAGCPYCADWSAFWWCPPPEMTMQLACASAWLPTDTCNSLLWREPTHLGLSNKLCTQPCPDQGCNDAIFFFFLCFVGGLNGAPPMLSFRPASCARWIRNRIERKEGIDTLHQPCSLLQNFYVLSFLLICIICVQMFCGNQNQRTLSATLVLKMPQRLCVKLRSEVSLPFFFRGTCMALQLLHQQGSAGMFLTCCATVQGVWVWSLLFCCGGLI